MALYTLTSLADLATWLKSIARDERAKGKGIARNKSDAKYYEGKAFAYDDLARMIDQGELSLSSPPPAAIKDPSAIDSGDLDALCNRHGISVCGGVLCNCHDSPKGVCPRHGRKERLEELRQLEQQADAGDKRATTAEQQASVLQFASDDERQAAVRRLESIGYKAARYWSDLRIKQRLGMAN